jgi:endoglucanase
MTWWRKRQALWCIVILVTLLGWTSSNAQSKFITTRGKMIVSQDGKPLLLKGINLGNWLMP